MRSRGLNYSAYVGRLASVAILLAPAHSVSAQGKVATKSDSVDICTAFEKLFQTETTNASRLKELNDSISTLNSSIRVLNARLTAHRDSLTAADPGDVTLVVSLQRASLIERDSLVGLSSSVTTLSERARLYTQLADGPVRAGAECKDALKKQRVAERKAALAIRGRALRDMRQVATGWGQAGSLGNGLTKVYDAGAVVTRNERAKLASVPTGVAGAVGLALAGFLPDSTWKQRRARGLSLTAGSALLAVSTFLVQHHADLLHKYVSRVARNAEFLDVVADIDQLSSRLVTLSSTLTPASATNVGSDSAATPTELEAFSAGIETEQQIVQSFRQIISVARGLQRDGADEAIPGETQTRLGSVISVALNGITQWTAANRAHASILADLRTDLPPLLP